MRSRQKRQRPCGRYRSPRGAVAPRGWRAPKGGQGVACPALWERARNWRASARRVCGVSRGKAEEPATERKRDTPHTRERCPHRGARPRSPTMARAFGGRVPAPDDERALAREYRAGVSPRVCCALLLVSPGFCCSVCSFSVRSLRSISPYRVR